MPSPTEIRDIVYNTLKAQFRTTEAGKEIQATLNNARVVIFDDTIDRLFMNQANNVAQIVLGWLDEQSDELKQLNDRREACTGTLVHDEFTVCPVHQ